MLRSVACKNFWFSLPTITWCFLRSVVFAQSLPSWVQFMCWTSFGVEKYSRTCAHSVAPSKLLQTSTKFLILLFWAEPQTRYVHLKTNCEIARRSFSKPSFRVHCSFSSNLNPRTCKFSAQSSRKPDCAFIQIQRDASRLALSMSVSLTIYFASYNQLFRNCGVRMPSRRYASAPTFGTSSQKKLWSHLMLLNIKGFLYIFAFQWTFSIVFQHWPLCFSSTFCMSLLCQVYFYKILIEWYLVEWVFLQQGVTQWQYWILSGTRSEQV